MIREVRITDLPTISDIYHQNVGKSPLITSILEPMPIEDWLKWLLDHPKNKYPAYILEVEGKVIGWGALNSYSPMPAYCGIVSRSTYVCNSEHGKGYGTILRNYGRELARDLNYHTLISYVHEGNVPSMVMAEKEGMSLWAKFPKAATCGKDRWDIFIYGISLTEPEEIQK